MAIRSESPDAGGDEEVGLWEDAYGLVAAAAGKPKDFDDPTICGAADKIVEMVKRAYAAGANDARAE
jgi:hypothetical protein